MARIAALTAILGFIGGMVFATFSSLNLFLPSLLEASLVTLQVSFLSFVVFVSMSFLAASGKIYGSTFVRGVSIAYIEIFRGTSLLVQLFWLFFVLPELGIVLSPLTAAVLGIGLNFGAYGAEVVRGAIGAVPKGQMEAGIALNIPKRRRILRLIFPQAFAVMLPGMTNQTIELIKATSVVSAVTLVDITRAAVKLNLVHFRTVEIFVVTLILYYLLCQIVRFGAELLEARVSRHRAGRA